MPQRRGNGDGSIYKAGNRWIVRVEQDADDGKRRRVKRTARTYDEARSILKELKKSRDAGLDPKRWTVGSWLADWLHRQRTEEDKSAATLAGYEWAIEHWLKRIAGKLLEELKPEHVRALLAEMNDAGRSKNTMMRVRLTLNMAMEDAVLNRKIGWNPVARVKVPKPKDADQKPEAERAFTVEQARTFLEAIEGDRWEMAWQLGLLCGLRPGEVTGLRWKDVDLDAGVLHVRQARLHHPDGTMTFGAPKAGSGRSLALDAGLVDKLRHHRKAQTEERLASRSWTDHGLVVCTTAGTPVDRRNLLRAFTKATDAARLGTDWHPHQLRHTFATLARNAGRPMDEIAADLGHRPGSKVTGAVYVHDQRAVRGAEAGAAIRQQLTGTD